MGVPLDPAFFEMSHRDLQPMVHSGTPINGTPMSAGCINLSPENAIWIYRWTTPVAEPQDCTNTVGARSSTYTNSYTNSWNAWFPNIIPGMS
jgi:hypothetical protein